MRPGKRLLGLLLASAALTSAFSGSSHAQATARYDHTTTLLPNGNILIVGGVNTAGTILSSVEIYVPTMTALMSGAALPVARSSHTATLLPNGRVLVAGGIGAGAAILSDAYVYDPETDSWTATPGMTTARYNHTATLLADGTVLIAGGQSGAAAVTASCEVFTPGSPGSFAATGSMSLARAGHTATMLYNDKVLAAGGYTLLASPNQYAVSTELFENGAWTPGPNLIQQRAYHTATVMGDRNVLIAGGYNGRNLQENQGILESVEIYNPVSDSVSPADPMEERRMFHSAALMPDGKVSVYGGLGNITTTYFPGSKTLRDPSDLDSTQVNVSTGSILSASSLVVPLDFILSKPANGVIANGDVLFSSPTITLSDSKIYFTNPGTRASLNGVSVGRTAGINFSAGQVKADVTLTNASGQVHFYPQNVTSSDPAVNSVSGGPTACTPATVGAGATASITTGTLTVPLAVTMPAHTVGGTVQATCELVLTGSPPGVGVAATITAVSSYTITLTTGIATACGGATVVSNGSGGGLWSQTVTFNTIQGSYRNDSSANRDCTTESFAATDPTVTGIGLRFTYVVTPLNVSNQSFNFDIATVTIKSMVFGDKEEYEPDQNAWAFNPNPGSTRFNHTQLLTPASDESIWGGRTCTGATCGSFAANTGPLAYIFTHQNTTPWTATSGQLLAPRANHTMTVLPNGKALVAGGTNGPNVLATAELYDETSDRWTATGNMVKGRNLHTATLLPNGNVLVAGGFTAQGLSSATNHTEVFYPDSGRWVAAAPMASTRSYHSAVLLPDGNVFAFGGYNGSAYLSSAEIYYSTAGVWRTIPTGAIPARAQHTASLLQDGRVLIVGGVNSGGILSDAWAYSTLTGAFAAQPSLPTNYQRHSHSATLLRDGRVLVAGGNDGFGEVGNAILFDPNQSPAVWTPTSSTGNDMLIPRLRHTATLLPDGKVLVSGGVTALGGAIQLDEGYDVDFSTWQAQGNMIAAKGFHATAVLPSGNLLNSGGFNGLSYLSASERHAFAYTPDLETVGGPPGQRRPTIVSVTTTTFDRGVAVTINGSRLKGVSEASGGGAGSANSSSHNPRIYLQRLEFSGASNSAGSGGFMLDLTTGIYSGVNSDWSKVDSSITLVMPQNPALLPYGWYHLRVAANAQYSASALVQAGPPRPTGAPGTPNGTLLGASSVAWTWAAAPGAFDGYNVYSATDGVFLGTAPSNSFVQQGLGTDSVAQIKVAAYNLSGDGQVAIATTPVNTLNSTINTVQGGGQTVSTIAWSWDAVSGAISYNVFSASTGFLVGTSGSNAFFQTGLATNTSAGIRVQAVTAGGAGQLSVSATAFTLAQIPLAAVPGLDSVSTGGFRAAWSANTNPPGTSYVLRITTPSAGFSESTVTVTALGVTNLPANSVFIASVCAVNGDGIRTGFAALGSTATFARPPTNLSAVSNNASTINLSWSNNNNPPYTIYQVLYSSDDFVNDFSTHVAFSDGFTNAATSIGGLLTGVTYTIRVSARNLFGQETASVSTRTATNNGGGPVGSLTVLVQRPGISAVSGTVGSGRTVGARFPAGVFDSPTVSVNIATSSILNCGTIDSALEITATPAEQPTIPFELSMSYDPAETGVTDPSKLTIVRYHPETGTCVPLTAHVDTVNRVVRAQVNHLSLFQLQQVSATTNLSNPRVFPNPLYTRNQGFFTFDRLPAGSRVRVYTLHGEELFEGEANTSGMIIWNARNKHERAVASGIYLALIQSGGEKKVLKLVVVR